MNRPLRCLLRIVFAFYAAISILGVMFNGWTSNAFLNAELSYVIFASIIFAMCLQASLPHVAFRHLGIVIALLGTIVQIHFIVGDIARPVQPIAISLLFEGPLLIAFVATVVAFIKAKVTSIDGDSRPE